MGNFGKSIDMHYSMKIYSNTIHNKSQREKSYIIMALFISAYLVIIANGSYK